MATKLLHVWCCCWLIMGSGREREMAETFFASARCLSCSGKSSSGFSISFVFHFVSWADNWCGKPSSNHICFPFLRWRLHWQLLWKVPIFSIRLVFHFFTENFTDNCRGEFQPFRIRFVFHFFTADWHLSELVIGAGWTSNSCTRPWLWVILMTSPISFNNSFRWAHKHKTMILH